MARALREDGLPVADDEMLTPVDSAITYIRRRHRDRPALLFASDVVRERMVRGRRSRRPSGEEAEVVFVAHVDEADLRRDGARGARGRARRAAPDRQLGARLCRRQRDHLQPRGDGHRGDRQGRRRRDRKSSASPRAPPSRRSAPGSGIPTDEIAVIGDDVGMDIALGRMGGSRTVLVRSGITGATPLDELPESRRPHAVIDRVADLLALATCWS